MERDSIFQTIKAHWHLAPVDVLAILRDAGIEYYELPLPKNVSGMLERAKGKYRIVVNASDSPARKRFTAAHELGHYVYHRDLVGDRIEDNRLYRSAGLVRYGNTNITQAHETEANRFASNLLMPKHLVRELEQKNLTITEMARALGVSVPAMRVRLGLSPTPTPHEFFDPIEDGEPAEMDGRLDF